MKLDDEINYFILSLSRYAILVLHLINNDDGITEIANVFLNAFVNFNFYLKVVLFVKIISVFRRVAF